ncbi:Eukaryotic translation initiation factor 3 subunit C [Gracilariopsis chorda]|uniref:Eukaryotic translation initiation factor 3 subunit C n=1 Tax=Gracilariopsis chorda TaxID=448386 RepID=A0A2V3IH82_9FLOR|nr:Eukaryotic translation initiation factor 3 subunit C [Gracilariopsis chorda]|eukprot:PXF40500.1 Eukaryotic translation initiation factor 3 subunit C [Gracilariopsis chorda]
MSRFFRNEDDFDSSTESESSSSEEDTGLAKARTTVGGVGKSRFMLSDSDDEDEKRVSKSEKDRRHDVLVATTNNIKSHIKNMDVSKLQEDFDQLNEVLKKIMKTDMVSGRKPPVPELYVRAVITIEDFVSETVKNKPKLSKTNAKSLNRMNLKVPKNNRLYKKEIDQLRATGAPSLYDMRDSDDSDEEDELQKEDVTDSEYDSDTDSTTSSDSDAGGGGGAFRRWLKKDKDETKTAASKIRKEKKVASKEIDAGAEADDEDDEGFITVSHSKSVAGEIFKPEEMSEEAVDKKMMEILQARGRKGTNRMEQISLIESLVLCAKSPRQHIELMLHLISAKFDGIPVAKLFMPADLWRSAVNDARKVISLAREQFPGIRFSDEADVRGEDPSIILKGTGTGEIVDPTGETLVGTAVPAVAEEQVKKTEIDAEGQIIVRGDVVSNFERFDDELFRAWQHTDAYAPEYVERLKDEVVLLDLASEVQSYFENAAEREESKKTPDDVRLNALRSRAARVAARRVMHMYYKTEELNNRVEELSGRKNSDRSMTELAVLVYRYGDDHAKSMVMLAHIYNHALENRFYAARDMLLMSHLQETIPDSDIPLQVMFNRAMTQLGLCAFRTGKPWEAHACLQELCSPSYGGGGGGLSRMKELLAQGITQQRGYEKTPEQEKAEARRQIPYHMHINLDFIETAHLTSAMLLEVPAMALSKARGDVRRWAVSKSFQYFLRNSMKQAFPGPPENTRDYVMAATRCLMRGDWNGAYNYICGIRSWKALTATTRAETQEKLKELLKVEALRTFSLSYSSYFDSMSTSQLSELFGLTPARVHSVLSKMIINMEMRASWDQPTASIVMRRTEPSRLQSLALQLASKVANMTENNEKLMDAKNGGIERNDRKDDERGKSDWKQGGRGGKRGKSGFNSMRQRDGHDVAAKARAY